MATEGRQAVGKVLIVYHTLSGNTKTAAQCVAEGTRALEGCQVILKCPPGRGLHMPVRRT